MNLGNNKKKKRFGSGGGGNKNKIVSSAAKICPVDTIGPDQEMVAQLLPDVDCVVERYWRGCVCQ